MKALKIVGLSAALACAALCGCQKGSSADYTSVVGEMNYTEYGTNYGIKVKVQVDGDTIKKVTVEDSDFVECSPAGHGWDPEPWNKGLNALLDSYKGKKVADVLAKEVEKNSAGAPLDSEDEGFKNFGDELIITGATIGSGRLLIAVQNALKKL